MIRVTWLFVIKDRFGFWVFYFKFYVFGLFEVWDGNMGRIEFKGFLWEINLDFIEDKIVCIRFV